MLIICGIIFSIGNVDKSKKVLPVETKEDSILIDQEPVLIKDNKGQATSIENEVRHEENTSI